MNAIHKILKNFRASKFCACGMPWTNNIETQVIENKKTIIITQELTCFSGHKQTRKLELRLVCLGAMFGEEACPFCGLNHRD